MIILCHNIITWKMLQILKFFIRKVVKKLNNFLESYGLEIYHKNKVRKGVKPINLTREQANRINKLYRIDFKIFG